MAENAVAAGRAEDVAAHAHVLAAINDWHAAANTQRAAGASTAMKRAEIKGRCISIVNAVGSNGATPLMAACLQGSADDAEALLALGADPTAEGDVPTIDNPSDTYKMCPISLA
eukprot:gene20243-8798_t